MTTSARAEPSQVSVPGRRPPAMAAAAPSTIAPQPSAAQTLQRRFGNQGTQALLRARIGPDERTSRTVGQPRSAIERQSATATLQTSNRDAISRPGDALEQEAERVADQVMRMPHPSAAVATEGASVLQRTAAGAAVNQTVPPIVHDVLRSPGRPLDAETRGFMEPRFGQDFGHVRVHTGDRAAEAASAIDARAFTSHRSVVFGAGEYAPQTQSGRRLLAHELTHVVQQKTGSLQRQQKEVKAQPDDQNSSDYLRVVDSEIANVVEMWGKVLLKQRDAVTSAETEAAKPDQPDLASTLLITAGELLLVAALGGIGGLVSRSVGRAVIGAFLTGIANKAKREAAAASAQLWIDKTTKAAVDAGKTVLKPSVRALVMQGSTPALAFFQSQREALDKADTEAKKTARREGMAISKQPNAVETVRGSAAALEQVEAVAFVIQAEKTTQAWFTYMAQARRGTSKRDEAQPAGTELSSKSDVFWSNTPGVLYLRVNSYGELISASLKGSTTNLVAWIQGKPIRDLKIPKIIEVPWGELTDKNLTIRINEIGTIWVPTYSQQVGRSFWLGWGGGHYAMGTDQMGRFYNQITGSDDQMWDGARNFAELVVGKQKLAGFLKPDKE
jgi:Domain of unknown function (DUF4157)